MNKQDLLKLEKIASLSPAEIKKQQPALFKKLGERASINLKNNAIAKLKKAPKDIRDNLAKLDFSPVKIGSLDIKAVLNKSLNVGRTTAKRKKEIETELAKLPDLGKLDDLLQPDVPILINPVFQPDLMKAKVYRLGNIAGLSQTKVERTMVKGLSLNALSNEKLAELVKGNTLTKKEAKKLGLASNLYALFDSNFELTEFSNKGTIPKINGKVNSLQDFIALDRADWNKFVVDAKVELPKELKPQDYAEILYKKVENLFPAETLTFRVSTTDNQFISNELTSLKPLLDQNDKVFGKTAFESLKTDNLNMAEIKKLKTRYHELNKIVRLHPGLRIDELLNDKQISIADRGKRVVERIGLLDKFIKNNTSVDYLSISYTHDSNDVSSLNFTGFKAEEKVMVLNSVKSYQRIYSFTKDIEHTEAIMAAGYHSAYQLTSVTLDNFVKATKLDVKIATRYFENAHESIIRTTGAIGSVLDVVTGSFDWTNVGNTSPSIQDYLKDIPGYQDLFGDLAFCDCEWCQSIYSPAAYFVDLMQFVEKHVINEYFSTDNTKDHVLNLKVRRPDLWVLPLTCENTTTLVPYLDIITEILESYIANKQGFAGDLGDRAAVEAFVYKGEIALEKPVDWKNGVHSFSQPFHLPLESLTTYLGHFERTREEVAMLLSKPELDVSTAKLYLSEKEFQLITVADNTPTFLNRIYGITFSVQAGKIKPFDAQLLLKPMNLTRKELGRLITTWFVTNSAADNIIIQGEKKHAASVQNDIERIKNLTFDALDRAHRFIRLWRKTTWSIEELDLILTQLDAMGISSEIDATSVLEIGGLLSLQEKLKVSVEELCALWGTIPTLSISPLESERAQKSLLDALFNHDDVVSTDDSYPKDTTPFIHPALILDNSTAPAEFVSGKLMAALNRSDTEVLTLIQKLAQPLGIININSAIESERGFNLTLQNLTLLYRHSKIAGLLKVSIDELFQLIKLIDSLGNGHIENAEQLKSTLDFCRWWKTTNYSLDELHFIVRSSDVVAPDDFLAKENVSKFVLDQTKAKNELLFADTIFAYFDDITEEQSKAIIAANTSIELSTDGTNYWLKATFDPNSAITIPPNENITRAEIDLRAFLMDYHPQTLIPHYVSSQLSLSKDQILLLINVLGDDLADDAYTSELQEITIPAVAIPQLVEKLIPLSLLFKDKKFDDDVLSYVLSHLNQFEIASIDIISVNNIQKLHLFAQFLSKQDDETYNVDLISDVVDAFVLAQQFQNADQSQLATLLNTESGLLATLHPVMGNSTNAFVSLEKLVKLVEITAYLGIGGDILSLIVSNSYDDLQDAAIGILAAFRTKYQSEEDRKEKLEAYEDKLRGKKRAALTAYLIHSGFPQFESENDLFYYFLIDTELEGCARTSRLVAATMSLQLYIHRILLNLEQDGKEPGAADKVHVPADKIPADEWDWRKNYRVWEANRKVFLYPENYIEPDLRDNKTPLFEELESELLQQEVNAETVLDAYAKYMRGFDEVAHLKIAGSYHEKDYYTSTDALHLFGVTVDDPPVYYYRMVENTFFSETDLNKGIVWNAWQKINVQIPVRNVAPIIFNGRLYVFWVRATTLSKTVFDQNRSIFKGYDHKFTIEFSTLKLDGSWTPPQKLDLHNTSNHSTPFTGNGVVLDPLAERTELWSLKNANEYVLNLFLLGTYNKYLGTFMGEFLDLDEHKNLVEKLNTPRYDTKPHYEPVDEYTLDGFMWDRIYPSIHFDRLVLTGVGYKMLVAIDFYNLSIQNIAPQYQNGEPSYYAPYGKKLHFKNTSLFSGLRVSTSNLFDDYAMKSFLVKPKVDHVIKRHWDPRHLQFTFEDEPVKIAGLKANTNIEIINNTYLNAIVDEQGDLLMLQGDVEGLGDNRYLLKRIGTTLSETLIRTLFTSGVDTILGIKVQKSLKEAPIPIDITNNIIDKVVKDKIDFKGAYGTYYREIFFHIPFLLANHLNSQGKYAEAQKWYHYIFNPSADQDVDIDPSLNAMEKHKVALDKNWQYLEFRGLNTLLLKNQLQDAQAIETYKKDPFNPHAIARIRTSAYQKNIVMKYIENLLDRGDQLFTQDSMESVNEATLLYIIAKEILGGRPAQIGDCGEGRVKPKTYEKISPLMEENSEFLIEMEHYTSGWNSYPLRTDVAEYALDFSHMYAASKKVSDDIKSNKNLNYIVVNSVAMSLTDANIVREFEAKREPEITIKPVDDAITGQFAKGTTRSFEWKKDSFYVGGRFKLPSFGRSVLSHVSPVFCVPGNKELLKYWDRVDDRLFKIRNCMNIQGQRRQLALFAPEIDPDLLVRLKAAGLTFEDILNSLSGNLPPYRFSYIIERAKAYTAVVQSFGASLLSAIEKRDGAELTQLQILHQHNILEMASKSRKLEIDSANEGIKALSDRIESTIYKLEYYKELIGENLIEKEHRQASSKMIANTMRQTEAKFGIFAAMQSLLPQLGSPFSLNFGGYQLNARMIAMVRTMTALASWHDNEASSAGLQAGFERRKQGWEHQKTLVQFELQQAEKTLIAAEIRRDILIESEKIHLKNIEHHNKVMEFYGEKFSNFGLYTFLSTTMQRLFKEAYNNAHAIAKLAEQAYQFERDDNTNFIDGDYFETPRAGLLAGERLFMGLQAMERRYLETNYRKNEIDQAFSITQLDPAALLLLKQTGTCEFTIPEVFFDLFYPGQYRRKIQSVRLTIPSVTGPYTNVSANLSLVRSHIRMDAKLGNAELKEVPKSRTTNIATSTAQNDAGVFQLNFNDNRYMPFEGAGAISSWKLSLPKNFRQFDYNTINDVIIHISYTAEYDELFRDKVEQQTGAIEGTLINVLQNNSLSRTFSFRQEFSADFNRLIQQAVNQPISFKIENKHFPLFMNGKPLKIDKAKLILVTPTGQGVDNVDIVINGDSQTGFSKDSDLGDLFAKDLGSLFNTGIMKDHTIAIANGGDLSPIAPAVGNIEAIDSDKLEDIILYVEYKME